MDPICRFDYILRYTLYLYSSQAIKSSVRLWPFISVCGLSSYPHLDGRLPYSGRPRQLS